ncbi:MULTISPECIES: DeoR/GlpR family DNA-binding transcription regulator [unclassified Bacillus (in: firmicutes)]|uniref:DeoR/GlpR family DNA-binding transcription regulator n=1 Tax=Bacillaceae TaxID=186817 RepID=UPI00066121E2|nr:MULTISPECIES: DeoR/GlpR family DNA-binding transcription regulator [unclassified Bacillus (in: firmicutes)]CAI9389158.1 putative HTH-type transcriptional regulator YdjF [Bacillus sp. T2.9-1]
MENLQQLNKRQNKIYQLLLNEGEIKIQDLTETFGVVEMTIRRDLDKMEKLGFLKRTYGGAILAFEDIVINKRELLNRRAKELIGQKAVKFVQEGDGIFVDAGTTTPYFVKNLPVDAKLSITTNALNVASKIHGKNKEKIILGGMIRESTSSLYGPIAISTLNNLSFDKAFLAASGFTLNQGFSNSNIFEVEIKQKVIKQSKEITFLIDHSKFDTQFMHKITSLENINRIITDKTPSNEYCKLIQSSGVELVVCSNN